MRDKVCQKNPYHSALRLSSLSFLFFPMAQTYSFAVFLPRNRELRKQLSITIYNTISFLRGMITRRVENKSTLTYPHFREESNERIENEEPKNSEKNGNERVRTIFFRIIANVGKTTTTTTTSSIEASRSRRYPLHQCSYSFP